jgi:hypothetical protein
VKALKKSSESEVRTAKERLATLIIEEKAQESARPGLQRQARRGHLSDDYQEKASSWRDRVAAIQEESKRLEIGHIEIVDEALRVLDLAQRAYALYMKQDDNFERRKLIEIFSSKVAISGGRVVSNWLEPFKTASKLAKEAG